VICVAYIVRQVDAEQLKQALRSFDWTHLPMALLLLAVGYVARIARWSVMLRSAGGDARFTSCAAPFLGSIAMNNVLPLRAGDVMRALVFPRSIGVTESVATGSLVIERLIDLLTLLGILLLGVIMIGGELVPEWVRSAAMLLGVATGIALLVFFALSGHMASVLRRRAPRSVEHGAASLAARTLAFAARLLDSTRAMTRIPVLAGLVALSVPVWLGETGLYWRILAGFGLNVDFLTASLIMAVITLSTLVPSSPGYVGPFHLAAYGSATLVGADPGQAASFALLAHLGVWLPTTIAGLAAVLMKPELFARQAKAPATQVARGDPGRD
jgi:hypothetical protein